MGCVYLAVDQRLGRKVAIKTLPSSLTASEPQRQRLRREARAAASLAHPGICTVYALEEIGDEVFIVTEFIEGRTLREEIDAGRPDLQTLRTTANELAAAIASAHERGITHRDLKPENVMRTKTGRLKVLDFGLALVDLGAEGDAHDDADRFPRVTAPGAFIGTPGYMAPEQLTGGPVDARTDVFAIGVLLYEFATGRHPFDAANPLVQAARILEAEPAAIETLRPDVPPDIANVVKRSLQKSPADRFASAGEIADALATMPERSRVDDAVGLPGLASVSSGASAWWRAHQVIVIGLYVVAAVLAWFVKEWVHGFAEPLFFAAGIAATVAGVFRGHLLFTERMNHPSFSAERRRASPVTLTLDLALGLILLSEGLLLTSTRAVAAVLTMALAAGLVLARVLLERSTTQAAFGEQ
jgi:hypothetical protein